MFVVVCYCGFAGFCFNYLCCVLIFWLMFGCLFLLWVVLLLVDSVVWVFTFGLCCFACFLLVLCNLLVFCLCLFWVDFVLIVRLLFIWLLFVGFVGLCLFWLLCVVCCLNLFCLLCISVYGLRVWFGFGLGGFCVLVLVWLALLCGCLLLRFVGLLLVAGWFCLACSYFVAVGCSDSGLVRWFLLLCLHFAFLYLGCFRFVCFVWLLLYLDLFGFRFDLLGLLCWLLFGGFAFVVWYALVIWCCVFVLFCCWLVWLVFGLVWTSAFEFS